MRTEPPIRMATRSPRAMRRRTVSRETSRRSAIELMEYSRALERGSCVWLPIRAHASILTSYATRTVTRRPLDPRDTRTDALQALVDRAIDDADARPRVAQLLFSDQPVGPPPAQWPAPRADAEEQARSRCLAAASAARSTLRKHRITALTSTLREFPEVTVAWDALRPDQPLPPAPLVHCLVASEAVRLMATLAAYRFAKHTRDLWNAEVEKQLIRRLNAFADLEIRLWSIAAGGGHREPPPYTVRYNLARWLWDPSVAGCLFCMRCGDELRYVRTERTYGRRRARNQFRRTMRCRHCSRGRESAWPTGVLEPYGRGTWLRKCGFAGCTDLFVGRADAHYCRRHRLNRLSPRRRVARRP
jgi:hypothetical protein